MSFFHHPSQLCKFWPSCTFGDQCLNIHPSCRYGLGCLNTLCTYQHPPGQRGVLSNPIALARGRGRGLARGAGRSRGGAIRGAASLRGLRGRGRGRGRGSLTLVSPGSKSVHGPCRFDPNCTSITCEFAHPIREATEKVFLHKQVDPEKQEGQNIQNSQNAENGVKEK